MDHCSLEDPFKGPPLSQSSGSPSTSASSKASKRKIHVGFKAEGAATKVMTLDVESHTLRRRTLKRKRNEMEEASSAVPPEQSNSTTETKNRGKTQTDRYGVTFASFEKTASDESMYKVALSNTASWSLEAANNRLGLSHHQSSLSSFSNDPRRLSTAFQLSQQQQPVSSSEVGVLLCLDVLSLFLGHLPVLRNFSLIFIKCTSLSPILEGIGLEREKGCHFQTFDL